MLNKKYLILIALAITTAFFPTVGWTETDLKITGWIPYWKVAEGTKDARNNLDKLDVLYPFSFTVKKDGSLNDLGDLENKNWAKLFREAKKARVEIIPTVMWSNANMMQQILSDPVARKNHIKKIVEMVEDGNYAGVDIDYEGKMASTKDFFSLFIEELKEELGDKTLVCTIEARTPPDSLYRIIPNPLVYANDYARLGQACDVFQIMTYDQQRADIKLNDAKRGSPYAPTADADWVEKVIKLALEDIPNHKIMLGVPTYGAEYEVTVSPNWYQGYKKLWALNPEYGIKTAKKYKTRASTNSAGELAFSYLPKESNLKLAKSLTIPKNTPKGLEIAARVLAHANKTGETVKFNYVS
ncbi:MAG: glycosyl hydrolase family 18 protein [Patescibacteria group bacterium]